MGFEKMGVCGPLVQALKKERITKPLPVQAKTFALIMEGKNAAVQSETGSGKTLAYVLPLMQRLMQQEGGNKILVLVPTHELAMQVVHQVKLLSQSMRVDITAVPIVGSVNIRRQVDSLKKKPQIIVGTCGRILELMQMKKIAAHLIQAVVVDEADKMLEKSQVEETVTVVKKCMRDVQKLFFSASLPQNVLDVIKEIAPGVQVIQTKDRITIPKDIQHFYVVCGAREKMQTLRGVISAVNPKKAMVFINRAYEIGKATAKLQYHNYSADCIYGSERKEVRKQVVENFRKGKLRILVGTDIASRGLHFDGVDTVVHYSIPENPKDYLHRAGRCGRNGQEGRSISIVTERELAFLKSCQKEFGIQIQECVLNGGRLLLISERSAQDEKIKQKTEKRQNRNETISQKKSQNGKETISRKKNQNRKKRTVGKRTKIKMKR